MFEGGSVKLGHWVFLMQDNTFHRLSSVMDIKGLMDPIAKIMQEVQSNGARAFSLQRTASQACVPINYYTTSSLFSLKRIP